MSSGTIGNAFFGSPFQVGFSGKCATQYFYIKLIM